MTLSQNREDIVDLEAGSPWSDAARAQRRARYRWAAQAIGGREVLEVGCGTGDATPLLAEAGATRVVAVDGSEAVIAEARRRSGDVAEFVVADPWQLPFPTEAFDAVVCLGTVPGDRPLEIVAELTRVLREQGMLFVALPSGEDGGDLESLLRRLFPAVSLYSQEQCLASRIELANGRLLSEQLVAAAKQGSPAGDGLVVVEDAVDVRRWQERIDEALRDADAALRQAEVERGRAEHAVSERHRLAQRLLEVERQQIDRLGRKIVSQAARIEWMEGTRSWRWTRPLRWVYSRIRRS